ncbi:phosphodiester glycosidase family protein [Paraglaciecola arctica]|uniref:Phosphodiester glycosidase domain-containing protein n=1 Tax=Paraglaciecola arctica BSs20135 TaxID=493475 RepID=K6XAN2_9ALTE|nr:phosphodiester glycosidase family protein [Paraglaciecola arctica]GAC17689.1 hypothetical protein GARC_0708 [Paraglaciecola arctica BSs20135]
MFSLRLLTRVVLFTSTIFISACSTSSYFGKELNLQQSQQQLLVPGLSHFQINKGQASGYFVLSSAVVSIETANLLKQKLEKFNTTGGNLPNKLPQLIAVIKPVEKGPNGNALGQLVTFGQFDTLLQAQKMQAELDDIGIHFKPTHSTQRSAGAGKQQISILKLQPSLFSGQVISALGNDSVLDIQKTSKIAQQNAAIAAVNGGFFAYQSHQGLVGDPAGIAVVDGTLVSEAVNGRPALLLRNTPALSLDILENVHSNLEMRIDDQQFQISGINRQAGKIFNCGQHHGDKIVAAIHDYVCSEQDEIIIYNHYFGNLEVVLKEQQTFRFFLDQDNKVYFTPPATYAVLPKGHRLVSASGKYLNILKQMVKSTSSVSTSQRIWSDAGEVVLEKGIYIINGGPTLLSGGKTQVTQRAQQGWDIAPVNIGSAAVDSRDEISQIQQADNSRVNFYQNWVLQRHPRTAVGITDLGTVFFVVVYGRDPLLSIGASVSEMADIMKDLGAVKAINLDGGGSSVMVIEGENTGKPSDTNGERAVAEALLFIAVKKV